MPAVSAEALRREFDGSFALPVRANEVGTVDFLAIRVRGKPFALRISEIAGVATGRRFTQVPSPNPALLGLVGVRGSLVAVFDLGTLLGEPLGGEPARWVALCGGHDQLAVAFDDVEGHLRLPDNELGATEGERHALVEHVIRGDDALRPIVSVPKIVDKALAGPSGPGKGT
jgi:chemotaxis signal transduction protein